MKKHVLPLVLLIAVLAACVKDKGAIPEDTLKAILLGKDTLSVYQGDVFKFDYTLTPSDYNPGLLKWHSSDTSVISITDSGKIVAKNVGTSKITVNNEANTIAVSCVVTVKADPLNVGLIAYYPFNGNALDVSGNGNNGTVYNATLTASRLGAAQHAYYFNGIDSYIAVNDNDKLSLNNTDFTISAWIEPQSFNNSFGSEIVSKRVSGYNQGYSFSLWGYANTSAPMGTYGFNGATSNATLNLAEWHMITMVYSQATQRVTFYKDVTFDSTSPVMIQSPASTNALLYIGRDNPAIPDNGYFFQGVIDDIRIYNRALNSNEIYRLYSKGD